MDNISGKAALASIVGFVTWRSLSDSSKRHIYQLLDELEPVEDNDQTFRPSKSLFYWPLAAALLLSFLSALLFLPWQQWFASLFNPEGRAR